MVGAHRHVPRSGPHLPAVLASFHGHAGALYTLGSSNCTSRRHSCSSSGLGTLERRWCNTLFFVKNKSLRIIYLNNKIFVVVFHADAYFLL
jgi:hypothetical protein